MWTSIILTDNKTGRSIHITNVERELFLCGVFSFDDLYEICQAKELVQL